MSFLQHFHRNVAPIRLIDKKRSWFMRLINHLLLLTNAIKITNIQGFLQNYGTTIGRTIYEHPGWSWDKEPDPHVVHELCHRLQSGVLQSLRYLISPKWRMRYEAECVQCELLCFPGTRDGAWFSRRIHQFLRYGVDEHDVRWELALIFSEIERGEPRKNAARVQRALCEWRRAETT